MHGGVFVVLGRVFRVHGGVFRVHGGVFRVHDSFSSVICFITTIINSTVHINLTTMKSCINFEDWDYFEVSQCLGLTYTSV